MAEPYIKLEGKDLGVIVGDTGGIGIYKPVDNLVLRIDMKYNELQEITRGAKQVAIKYDPIRQVVVNSKSIWRNKDCYDLEAEGVKWYLQTFMGRGDVTLELRESYVGVDRIVDAILDADVGLNKVE